MSYTSYSSKQLNYKQEAEMEIINLLDFTDRNELRNWLTTAKRNRVGLSLHALNSPHTNVFHTLRSLRKHYASDGLIQL